MSSTQTINTVMKTAASKVTGDFVEGSSRSKRRYAAIKTTNYSGNTLSTQNNIRLSQSVANTNVTSPQFYTPFTTPSAFQIPNNRKEVYLWAQWYFDNEPKVAAAIEFYTDFPVSSFELECANGYVKDYFEKLVKKLNFAKWLPLISQEYHLRGDVFLLSSIDCQHCHGLNVDENGDECKHDGATWRNLSILNPDTIEQEGGFMSEEPYYYMTPTEEMVKVCQEKKPKRIYDKIPDELKRKYLSGQPIYFDPISFYHMKRGSAPWQPYGTSMIRRLFTTLAYKDKLRQAQWLVAERHIVPIKVCKIGSEERPASDDDIRSVQDELTNVANDPLLTLVTHHNFNLEYVGASGKVLTLTNEFELIDQDIIDGFMLNKAIINGEGPSYSNAQVGLLTMSKRLERLRGEIAYWIEEIVFKPEAMWNGFTVEGKRGEEELIYPTIKWSDLELRDNTNKLQMMAQAQQNGIISAQTFIETMGIDYDQEVERLRFEQTANFISSPDASIMAGGKGYGDALGEDEGGGAGGLGSLPLGGGDGNEKGGAPPGAPGAPGAPGEMGGGAPGGAPGAMASNSSEEAYRFAFSMSQKIYDEAREPFEQKLNQRIASKKIKGSTHKEFLENTVSPTGRGYCGLLPEEPDTFMGSILYMPFYGGQAIPLNIFAQHEDYNLRLAGKKQEKPAPKMFFTKLEQQLYNIILNANIPYAFYAQYQAGPGLEYQLDGAFPDLKLGVEADSKTFHGAPEKIASDKQRDISLAGQGWTILRFTEEEIAQQPQEILKVLFSAIRKLGNNSEQETKI